MKALLLLLLPGAVMAADPAPADFAWRASLEAPAGTLARVAVPGDALMQARSAGLADLRVFDASGKPVAFAVRRPEAAAAAPVAGNALPAHVLTRERGAGSTTSGSIQVQVKGAQGESAWVQFNGAPANAGTLPSVLVDLRQKSAPSPRCACRPSCPPTPRCA